MNKTQEISQQLGKYVIMGWPLLVSGSEIRSKKVLKFLEKYNSKKMKFACGFWDDYRKFPFMTAFSVTLKETG